MRRGVKAGRNVRRVWKAAITGQGWMTPGVWMLVLEDGGGREKESELCVRLVELGRNCLRAWHARPGVSDMAFNAGSSIAGGINPHSYYVMCNAMITGGQVEV